ncbi:hypothetical protein [Rhizobacter sp. Root404]|jgi:hypothetical protein|uniref:hypothetical protein n=1 Tax=Rhizobacter sp. Root404 TaxID=1736528 RepID=UPI0006FCC010|nr:hypothetical protein [Rhizobacter sp. Root404]KQW36983.1 hypothetical protein ASC76_20510 [Rhizobacter sp. Root404]
MQDLTALLFAILAIAVTAIASRWWYRRERLRLESKLGRVNADRDVLHEQVKKAREQVAQLQKELSARRQAATALTKAAPTAAVHAPMPTGPAANALAGGLLFEAPQLAAHGFADTQPFSESTFPGLRPRP